VLADGHIVEQGSHTELIHSDSYYARLVRKQAHGQRLPPRYARMIEPAPRIRAA
jgi:ABC-type transport system involved in cytochrome bd biosynthesis fused ATPase/permease subunit